MGMILRMIPSWVKFSLKKGGNDWVWISLGSKSFWWGTRMEFLRKTSLGRTMAWCGLSEETFPTRDRIFLVMGEDPPMGLVPTPK